ncbi:MAG TPA: glycosyltransferase family 25 protein [Alicycliphilus sp.]|nr:glycosyltransferase family 25 protein [Alicycliphilus sp.]HRP21373.1 glycosyltransferase family 25 protein [Alicycliphilus sp.]
MADAPYPIWYINLARDVERRERMEQEFARLGLIATRLEAVWWADLPPERQDALYAPLLNQHQYYQPLANGEKGCYASHVALWQALLTSDATAFVVLEDDVCLDVSLAQTLHALAKRPTDWDMVKLQGRPREKVRASRALGDRSLVQYERVPSMTAGYVVSRSGARKLLASRLPFGRPIDVDLRFWWENGMRILGIVPAVVQLDTTSEVSSIWAQRPRKPLVAKWRKFRMKLRMGLLNHWHLRHQAPP